MSNNQTNQNINVDIKRDRYKLEHIYTCAFPSVLKEATIRISSLTFLKINLFFLPYKSVSTQIHFSINGIRVLLILIVPLFFVFLYPEIQMVIGQSDVSILTASCIPKGIILVLTHINLVSIQLSKCSYWNPYMESYPPTYRLSLFSPGTKYLGPWETTHYC